MTGDSVDILSIVPWYNKILAGIKKRCKNMCANVTLRLCANDLHFCAQTKFSENVRKSNSTDFSVSSLSLL